MIMRAQHQSIAAGFTLIELMVVLVVLAIAASVVTMSVMPASEHALETAAENLASTLEAARWQAISTRRRIAWEAPATSQAAAQWFDQSNDGTWQLRVTPAAPLNGVITIVQPRPASDAPPRLILGPEPVGAAVCVLLTQANNTMAVVSDGVAPFSVKVNASC